MVKCSLCTLSVIIMMIGDDWWWLWWSWWLVMKAIGTENWQFTSISSLCPPNWCAIWFHPKLPTLVIVSSVLDECTLGLLLLAWEGSDGALLHLHHDCDDDDDDVGGDESDDNDDDADDLNVIWGGGGISDGELNGPQCNLHSVQIDHPDHDDDGGCNALQWWWWRYLHFIQMMMFNIKILKMMMMRKLIVLSQKVHKLLNVWEDPLHEAHLWYSRWCSLITHLAWKPSNGCMPPLKIGTNWEEKGQRQVATIQQDRVAKWHGFRGFINGKIVKESIFGFKVGYTTRSM